MTEFEDMNLEEILSEGFDIVTEEINISDLSETKRDQEQELFPILPVRNMVQQKKAKKLLAQF